MKSVKIKIPTKKVKLSNGITLLVKEEHSKPIISVASYFLGGRQLEKEEKAGISTLHKRLLLKGTKEMDAFSLAEEMEYRGIRISPFSSMDTTGVVMKTISRHFDVGLDLFFKIITEPRFSEEEIEKERKNLLDDIKKEKDSTLEYALNLCRGLVFEGHPYGLPAYGTEESVKNITREDILEYHRLCFCPSRMVISLVGDIKLEYAQKKLEEYFTSFDVCSEIPEIPYIKGPIKNVKRKVESYDKQQVAICVGFHAPHIFDEDFYTFRVLNQVLASMGSRLFLELRDKMGLAYHVSSSYSGFMKGGIFRAYILTGYHQKEKARLALLEEVDRMRTRLVSYDELVRAKRYHLGLFDIKMQKYSYQASQMAYYELVGLGHNFVEEYPERIKRITRQKVKRAAEKYLKPQSYAISLLTPTTFPKTPQ